MLGALEGIARMKIILESWYLVLQNMKTRNTIARQVTIR